MTKPQPSSTKEFKQEAVQLVETSKKSKTVIARDPGIAESAWGQCAVIVAVGFPSSSASSDHARAKGLPIDV